MWWNNSVTLHLIIFHCVFIWCRHFGSLAGCHFQPIVFYSKGEKRQRNMKQLLADVSITKIILSRLTVSQDEKCVHSSASIDVLRLRTAEKKREMGGTLHENNHHLSLWDSAHLLKHQEKNSQWREWNYQTPRLLLKTVNLQWNSTIATY